MPEMLNSTGMVHDWVDTVVWHNCGRLVVGAESLSSSVSKCESACVAQTQ